MPRPSDSPPTRATSPGDLRLGNASDACVVDETYSLRNSKRSEIRYLAHTREIPFVQDGKTVFKVMFSVGNNDVAFRYTVCRTGEALCGVVRQEAHGVQAPRRKHYISLPAKPGHEGICPHDPKLRDPLHPRRHTGQNGLGEGYSFPALFRIADRGWVLISETGVDSRYCASRLLGHAGGLYTIGFPQEEEFNGNGSASPGITLPGRDAVAHHHRRRHPRAGGRDDSGLRPRRAAL